MRQFIVLVGIALFVCPGSMAWAAEGGERAPVRQVEVLTSARTCPFAPGTPEGRALRACYDQARAGLVDKAAPRLGEIAGRMGARLSTEELRAFAWTSLSPEVEHEEVRSTANAVTAVVRLGAEMDRTGLAERLASFGESRELRNAALAEYRAAPRPDAGASGLMPPSGGQIAAEVTGGMSDIRERAVKDLRPGMSMADVQGVLGDPKSVKQGLLGTETYVCAGYGRVWAVFRDGRLSCLRERLDYVSRYDGDCHCAGRLTTIIWND